MYDLINNKSLTDKNKVEEFERITRNTDSLQDAKEVRRYSKYHQQNVELSTTDPALIFEYQSDRVIVNEFLDWIYTIIQNLSERERICWWERVVNGKRYREISEEYDYSVQSIPKATKRANGFIRDMLRHCPLDLKEVKDALRGV